MLLAAIVGSTDAAAVFALLRNSGVRLNERVQATLEIESGANDPMAILLVTAMVGMLLQPETASVGSFVWMLTSQLGLAPSLGLAGGWVLSRLMARLSLPDGLYALLILSGGTFGFRGDQPAERQRLSRHYTSPAWWSATAAATPPSTSCG